MTRFFARIAGACVIPLMISLTVFAVPVPSLAQVSVGVVVQFGPPALPYYAQPLCPGPGYIWTPGYWAWDPAFGFFWVPGTWVLAPFSGALWTPGYWAWVDADDGFVWYPGYWGPVVGFYGGIYYGYGYTGYGYQGGYWRQGVFYYNRAVNQVNVVNITNVYYSQPTSTNGSRVSYNGGTGGINARPDSAQLAAQRERRDGPVREQMNQMNDARRDPGQRASYNHGAPPIAATPQPGRFMDHGVIRATRAGAPYHPAQPNRGPGETRGSSPSYTPAPRKAGPPPDMRHPQPPNRGNPTRANRPHPQPSQPHPDGTPHPGMKPNPVRPGGPPQPRGKPQPPDQGRKNKPDKPHKPCCSGH
ncbi:MAG: YXWGXW repeat-containing protein [Acidobacteriota bacterium]|nr:YXWGXW repeat-containing protein [Acidobacteriota bacterium]